MASKKKKKKVFRGKTEKLSDAQLYRAFMDSLMGGVIHAVQLYESRTNGKLQLEFDEEEDG